MFLGYAEPPDRQGFLFCIDKIQIGHYIFFEKYTLVMFTIDIET